MLAKWEEVRKHIVSGCVAGYALCLRDRDGRETIYVAGQLAQDTAQALKASLLLSWEMTQAAERQRLTGTE